METKTELKGQLIFLSWPNTGLDVNAMLLHDVALACLTALTYA